MQFSEERFRALTILRKRLLVRERKYAWRSEHQADQRLDFGTDKPLKREQLCVVFSAKFIAKADNVISEAEGRDSVNVTRAYAQRGEIVEDVLFWARRRSGVHGGHVESSRP